MAPIATGITHLANPLATPEQLSQSASHLDGVPHDLEQSIRYQASCMLQAVGILLRLPQQTIAETIDVAAAALYLVTKPGPYPLSPKQILNALYYVIHAPGDDRSKASASHNETIPYYSEGRLDSDRAALIRAESQILSVLGFQTHVALPHALCINYLQTLDAITTDVGHDLARRACAHLNSALLSPQLIYLTHQPCALAAAAIYLAARETQVNLPEDSWWEVFDVDREELGFLVVAMTSMVGFAEHEQMTTRRASLLTIDGVREEVKTRHFRTDNQS
ncbi:Cyclin-L2 [Sphaceloma murrayae]|uniref:Cyclin-L2 n=1 Tax=Sphaceloma murrayae TaxID=2082308 RepID=A0A2K1R0E2_9PEZI|nr:Cyclin-L2 [Sphaceloma murrayae]